MLNCEQTRQIILYLKVWIQDFEYIALFENVIKKLG